MSRPCDSFRDRSDRALCRFLADQELIVESALDAGFETFRPEGDRFIRETHGSGDGRVSPEFYDRVIALAESRKDVWKLLKDGRSVPWARFHLEQPDGGSLRDWILSLRASMPANSADAARHVFDGLKARIAFDEEESGPARNPLDVHRDGKANCIEFVGFFLMAADLLGIPAVPMELFQGANGNFVEHVRIGIRDKDTGRITHTADLANGHFGEPAEGEKWIVLSRREFLSDYYNLTGVREPSAKAAEEKVDLALDLNPRNYLALYNKAYYAAQRDKPTHALSYLLKSISAYPRYPLAYWNLRRVADQLGQREIAAWALERYRELYSDGP